MYIRHRSVRNRLGTFEGELGQIPNQMITITDPVDGAQLTFNGPVHEIAQVQAVVGLVSGAVSAAKASKFNEANNAIASAKKTLPATGSQKDKATFLVNKAEKFVVDRSKGTSAGEVLTGVGAILQALAPAGTSAFQTYTEAQAAKAALKGQSSGQPTFITVPAQQSNTGLIVAVVGGVVLLGAVLMMQKKK